MLRQLFARWFTIGRSAALPALDVTAPVIGWDHFTPGEQRRLAAKYLGVAKPEVGAEGLAETAQWFSGIGLTQRLSLMNAFFALGGGEGATPERRALWEQIARIIPGKWNSNIGELSVIIEMRDPERFKAAGLATGMREDRAFIRNKYHPGASFSLREWGVKASLNVANDAAAATAVEQGSGGGKIARVEFDAYGPQLSLFGLLRHKFGKIDAQSARWELAQRGFIPGADGASDGSGQGPVQA